MSDSTDYRRVCPTRIDRASTLFAHRVTVDQCQDRQRGRYHKCYTCAYNNPYVALNGLPPAQPPVEAVATATDELTTGEPPPETRMRAV